MTLRYLSTSLALISVLAYPGLAQDATFGKSKYSSLKSPKEIPVDLSVMESKMSIRSKKTGEMDLEIPYALIDKMSYELAARHRIAEGAAVMALSLGAGAILMATKTKSHWLAIEYHDKDGAATTILRLDKSEYKSVISTVEARTGKPVAVLDAKTSPLNPTAGSKDMDELAPFQIDKVTAALPRAMEDVGCSVTDSTPGHIECKRGRGASERTGSGGEKVTATYEAQGDQTHVRIWTGKGFVGRVGKKNWSTPVYQALMKRLQAPSMP